MGSEEDMGSEDGKTLLERLMQTLTDADDAVHVPLIIALCHEPGITPLVLDYLPKLEDEAKWLRSKPRSVRAAGGIVHICVKCKEAYSSIRNRDNACTYHPGNLQIDEESPVWSGYDEAIHGPMDTAKNREKAPKAFFWDCCDDAADASGCVTTYHYYETQPTETDEEDEPGGSSDGDVSMN